jgi:hypothetical protein
MKKEIRREKLSLIFRFAKFRRFILAGVMGAIAASAFSGCVFVHEHHDRDWHEHEHHDHDWDHEHHDHD